MIKPTPAPEKSVRHFSRFGKCLTPLSLALFALSIAGCASGSDAVDASASTRPSRVYHVGREEVWNTVRTVALSIPMWDIVTVDEAQGLVFVEQRIRDRSAGGESRMAIAVTTLDETHTKVEVQTIAAGSPRGQREHSVWRFFGELDQLVGSAHEHQEEPR